ncbi:MAG: hypothetical protein KIT09_03250 [Bryobacteraceae bacterium]|nr:hypothetical protein [Bryobacteraceae bacterium]
MAFERKDGKVVYFPGLLPVFQHDEKDLKSFRMPPLRQRAQALLDEGKSVPEVSREIGVAGDTLRKAIGAGRLHAFRKKR